MNIGISNQHIADRLREAADLLEQQGANPFRVQAYRRAATTVNGQTKHLESLLAQEGMDGLIDLPGVGSSLAAAIAEIIHTGRWAQLERLRGSVAPEKLFQSIPGLGPELAHRIYSNLHVDTLEALEMAAHDGRLEKVPGIGPRRAAMLRATLSNRLSRTRFKRAEPAREPEIELLLEVDREYREKAARKELATIAPRRFNPEGKSWLPILHHQLGDWHFTAMFSNTARAHELQRVFDWIVIYFHKETQPEGQRTVVTETHGALIGKRVVRGREAECRAYYDAHPATYL